jgi:hypothetical protein
MGPLFGAALFLVVATGNNLRPDHNIGKCPAFTMIWGLHPTDAGQSMGRPAPMTAQVHKTEQEYEAQVRNLLRLVSACTLGLWSFSAGLLIGTFFLF